MGNAQVNTGGVRTTNSEHPDYIKARMDALHTDVRETKERRLALVEEHDSRKWDYVQYIGEDRLDEVENDNVWVYAIEPTFTRTYLRSKESKALRDMASVWKKLHDVDDYLLAKERDLEELNDRLARSLSLTSTHGLLRQTMKERDLAFDERELMRKELESALNLAKTNIMKRLNESPSLILRLKAWELKHFLPGPDPRHRDKGRQERTVGGLLVEATSNAGFLEFLRDLAAHKGLTHQYGFSVTKTTMLTSDWGFMDPMPFHGVHSFQGRSESVHDDLGQIKPDESVILGFHYNRHRTNVVQTASFALPETTFDHYPDRREYEDILGLMSKIYEVPGMIAQLYTESNKKPTTYCLKIIRIAI